MNQTEKKPQKKQYDEAFRRNAVALMESSESSLQEIAADLGVSHWNLCDFAQALRQQIGQSGNDRGAETRDGGAAQGEPEPCEPLRDFKKSLGHPCRAVRERYEQMKTLEDQYRKQELCAAFEVSRSGYHRWSKAALSARKEEDARISTVLCEIHTQSRKTYGRPRLRAALANKGWRCSQKRVRRLMRQHGLRGVQRGRFRPQTTRSGYRAPVPNLLLGRETPKQPGKVWVADITYIRTREGWLYLAGVMDQGSRRILGLAFDTRLDSSLCEAALKSSLENRQTSSGTHPPQRSRQSILQQQLPKTAARKEDHSKHEP